MALHIDAARLKNMQTNSYFDIRSKIETGDFLFCSGNYAFSSMIKAFTGSVWSHVGVLVVLEELDRIFVLESVEDSGVRFVPLSNYFENYENGSPYEGEIVIAKADDSIRSRLKPGLDWALERIGNDYDDKEVVRIAGRITLGSGRYNRDDNYICSELIEGMWRVAGHPIEFDRRGFVTPETIWCNSIVTEYVKVD